MASRSGATSGRGERGAPGALPVGDDTGAGLERVEFAVGEAGADACR